MTMYRVQTAWGGAGVTGGGLTTMYFDEAAGTAQQAATAVGAWLTSVKAYLSSAVNFGQVPDVGLVDEATGQLIGAATVTVVTGTGAASGDALPPANQILVRWLSNTFVNGRRVRGRTFLPGIPETASSGTLAPATVTGINTASATLVGATNANLVVYSRRNGSFSQVDSADTWGSFAVLRGRRD